MFFLLLSMIFCKVRVSSLKITMYFSELTNTCQRNIIKIVKAHMFTKFPTRLTTLCIWEFIIADNILFLWIVMIRKVCGRVSIGLPCSYLPYLWTPLVLTVWLLVWVPQTQAARLKMLILIGHITDSISNKLPAVLDQVLQTWR